MLGNTASLNSMILFAVIGAVFIIAIFMLIFVNNKRREKFQRQVLTSQINSRANTIKYKEGYATTEKWLKLWNSVYMTTNCSFLNSDQFPRHKIYWENILRKYIHKVLIHFSNYFILFNQYKPLRTK